MAVKRHLPAASTKLCKWGICRSVVALGFYLECIFALDFFERIQFIFLDFKNLLLKVSALKAKGIQISLSSGIWILIFFWVFLPLCQ